MELQRIKIKKYHIAILQTNPRHREEEPQNTMCHNTILTTKFLIWANTWSLVTKRWLSKLTHKRNLARFFTYKPYTL